MKMNSLIFIVCCMSFLTSTYATNESVPSTNSNALQNALIKPNSTTQQVDMKMKNSTNIAGIVEGGPVIINKSSLHSTTTTTSIGNENKQEIANNKTQNLNNTSSPLETSMSRPHGREGSPVDSLQLPEVTKESKDVSIPKEIPVVETQENTLESVAAGAETEHKKNVVARKGAFSTSTPAAANVSASDTNSSILSSLATSTNASTTSTSTTTTTTTTTTIKPLPKKPLVTVGNDDEPFAPSHFVSSKKNGSSKSVPKVPTIESYEYSRSKSSSSDYIVPIVGVILSVPLVSVLLNVIYKRTKEWWHHRHYSRMDFLIDGMYNN